MNYHTVKTAMRQSDGRVTKYFTLCALILSRPFSSLLRVGDDDDDEDDDVQQREREYRREHQILARAPLESSGSNMERNETENERE